VKIVDLSGDRAILNEHAHAHEEKDLHLWLNPTIVVEQVEEMRMVLTQQLPDLAETIAQNGMRLTAELRELDSSVSARLLPFQGCYLLVSHPALGYYCQRYGLHQLSIEVEGKDPLPQDIAHLMEELKGHPVPVVLIEPQYNRKGAVLIADKLHIPYEEINPYEEDYFGMLNHLTEVIVKYYGHSSS
jgi:zinc transport system substrate-binding protein